MQGVRDIKKKVFMCVRAHQWTIKNALRLKLLLKFIQRKKKNLQENTRLPGIQRRT